MKTLGNIIGTLGGVVGRMLARRKAEGGGHAATHAESVADRFAAAARATLLYQIGEIWQHCGSEIERRLVASLAVIDVPGFFDWDQKHPYPRPYICHSKIEAPPSPPPGAEWFSIHAQCPVLEGKYRADFLLTAMFEHSKKPLYIIIECDGHDFHERTKEQAARDRRRDRDMTAAGFKVFRFTGSEIFRDADRCAAEVETFLRATEYEQRKDAHGE